METRNVSLTIASLVAGIIIIAIFPDRSADLIQKGACLFLAGLAAGLVYTWFEKFFQAKSKKAFALESLVVLAMLIGLTILFGGGGWPVG